MNLSGASNSGGAGSNDSSPPKKNSKRPKYSRFTQQKLPACKPILTPQWVISVFALISIIFVPIGVASLLHYGMLLKSLTGMRQSAFERAQEAISLHLYRTRKRTKPASGQ